MVSELLQNKDPGSFDWRGTSYHFNKIEHMTIGDLCIELEYLQGKERISFDTSADLHKFLGKMNKALLEYYQ